MKHITKTLVVVGGCNFDIYATSDCALIGADSNPGRVYTTPGGVGRNIAENLARLGSPTLMLSALGMDAFGDAIIKNAAESGLDLSRCLRLPHLSTSVYVCINNCDGDIAVAVSDMNICDCIDPAYLESCSDVLDNAAFIVADTNLSEPALHYLAHRYGSKLCVDCVSAPKASKLLPLLDKLYCIKANRAEASVISGISVETAGDAELAAKKLHQKGIKLAMITLGESGAYVTDGNNAYRMPLMPGETRNTSGCGDAFFAGALAAMAREQKLKNVLRNGLAMARLCAASDGAVSPQVSQEALEQTLQMYQGGAWQ